MDKRLKTKIIEFIFGKQPIQYEWICDICGKRFNLKKKAEKCEKTHIPK